MKAAYLSAFGGPEQLVYGDVPEPDPSDDGSVLVDVEATSVNNFDVELREGLMPLPFPHVLGLDVVGRLAEAPPASGLAVGDRVMALPIAGCGHCRWCRVGRENVCPQIEFLGMSRPGGYGERVRVWPRSLLRLDDTLTLEEAAAFPLVYTSAWHLLTETLAIRPGENLLVMNASGGLGIACIQIGAYLRARVLASTRDPEKAAVLRRQGADDVLLDDASLEERLRELVPDGVDALVDHTGGAGFASHVGLVARGGRVGLMGSLTGDEAPVNLRQLYFDSISLRGSTLGGSCHLEAALAAARDGGFRPLVQEVLDVADAARAHELAAAPDRVGKVVLVHRR